MCVCVWGGGGMKEAVGAYNIFMIILKHLG